MPRPRRRALRLRREWKKICAIALVPAAIGFTSMNRTDDHLRPGVVVQAEEVSHVPAEPALPTGLPAVTEKMPRMGSPEFVARVRAMGLDPKVVAELAAMAKKGR